MEQWMILLITKWSNARFHWSPFCLIWNHPGCLLSGKTQALRGQTQPQISLLVGASPFRPLQSNRPCLEIQGPWFRHLPIWRVPTPTRHGSRLPDMLHNTRLLSCSWNHIRFSIPWSHPLTPPPPTPLSNPSPPPSLHSPPPFQLLQVCGYLCGITLGSNFKGWTLTLTLQHVQIIRKRHNKQTSKIWTELQKGWFCFSLLEALVVLAVEGYF